ncbi:MAG: hypothetical protein OQJ98_02895 [Candidatus Pacebacteria bacterium]|nr:hypothetical protein [Candidatus Paceibacterota bacterium]
MPKKQTPKNNNADGILYITNEEMKRLKREGDWPAGLEMEAGTYAWLIPRNHPRHTELMKIYGTQAAKDAFLEYKIAQADRGEKVRELMGGPKLVPRNEREHLYIIDPEIAHEIGADFDHMLRMWFVPKGRSDVQKLKKKYQSKQAIKAWTEQKEARRKRDRDIREAARQDRRFESSENKNPRGGKPGPKVWGDHQGQNISLGRVAEHLAADLFRRREIDENMTKTYVFDLIARTLRERGFEISVDTVRKHLGPDWKNFLKKLQADQEKQRKLIVKTLISRE